MPSLERLTSTFGMKTIFQIIVAVAISVLGASCVMPGYRSSGRVAALMEKGSSLQFTKADLDTIEAVLAKDGDVGITKIEIFAPDTIRITTETYRSQYPIYEYVFTKRGGAWFEGPDEAIVILELFGKGKNPPNQPPLQTPGSGTPAAGAPVAPPPGIAGR